MANELTGKTYEGEFVSEIFDQAVFRYIVYIPKGAEGEDQCALLVTHDGLYETEVKALEQLAETGEAPHCVTVAVFPGRLPATVEGGKTRNLRMNSYDMNCGRYADFVADELIPHVGQKYDLHISASPDMRMLSGASSGGISAWNIAWRRNDCFRRVYMASPSFLSMGRGEEPIELMRKFEPKPIRVWTEFSGTEPDDYFGSSFCAADAAERALRFAGYDMEARFYPELGHSGNYRNEEISIERMRFLWKGWQSEPVRVKEISARAKEVILPGEGWAETELPFPECRRAVSTGQFTREGVYTGGGQYVHFTPDDGTRHFLYDELEDISCMGISSDKWRLYIGDRRRGCVYAASIQPDGTLGGLYIHAALHHDTEFRYPGALDMCVDSEDRLYVATELGVQLIRSFGLIDLILENPEGRTAQRIEIGEDGYLYAEAGGKVFRRRLNGKYPARAEEQSEPKYTGYYD